MEMNPLIDQEMENLDDDDVLLPLPDEQEQLHPSTPAIPQSTLKRLKKASSSSAGISFPDPPESRKTPDFEVSVLKYVGLEKEVDPDDGPDPLFGDLAVSGRRGSHDFAKDGEGVKEGGSDGMEKEVGGVGKVQKEMDLNDGLDPLFGNPVVFEGWESHDFGDDGEDENEGGTGGLESGNKGMDKLISDLGKEKSVRKRLNWDGGEEEGLKKKKKGKIKDEKPKDSVREKRKLEKERKAYLEQIHSESQRILRETRDASFKPTPIVHKPISSVLERIRNRKLELLKQCSVESDSFAGADCSVEEDIGQTSSLCRPKSNDGEILESDDQVAGAENCKASPGVSEDAPYNKPRDEDLNDALQQNSDDTLGLENVPKRSDGENSENGPLDDTADDILADNLTSSLPISISKLKSDDDLSSSHEDSDKENNDPHPCKVLSKGSYPKDDLGKTYVDDEAEEEDDSDHDLMRFQESEDDDSDENEVLDDLIMTGYEEAPFDQENRNQLHQKWLEQQDANETDNVLQRLKCGQIRREPSIIDDEDDNVDTDDEASADEMTEDQIPANLVRKNSKKAKQMMAQMFTDETDVYVSSEDEEIERSLISEHLLKQRDLGPSFISPTEDEHSKKVFGLIKKLNIAPDYKKKGKQSKSSLDMLITDTTSNSSSKSSFLARAQSNSLPASHKQGSITVRTFVFGRDDSSSRSSFSASENIDANQQSNQPLKTPGTRYSSTQSKATSFRAKAEVKTNSSSSLLEILKSSSVSADKKSSEDQSLITESQASHQFSAFKLVRKSSR